MIDAALLAQFADNLNFLAERIRAIQTDSNYNLSLPISQVRAGYPSQALAGLEAWIKEAPDNVSYIYKFSVPPSVDTQALHQAFERTKNLKVGNRAYARLQSPSPVLYVGSSSALSSRIKQHLGYGAQRTYAMQLSLWLPELAEELQIDVWRFAPCTDKAVLQLIEDSLWAHQRPMLGRQGAR